jgi:glycosyltransferase involved in cell wall biosynthesis
MLGQNLLRKSQKILIDARMLGAANAGIGRSIKGLVDKLMRLDRDVAMQPFCRDAKFCVSTQYYLFLTKENFDEINLLSPNWHKVLVDVRWYTLKEQFAIPRAIKKIQPDLVYFPHFNVPLFYRGKFIVTIHDLIWLKHPRARKEVSTLGPVLYWVKNLFSKIVFRSTIRRAQKIITPTEFTKKEIISFYRTNPDKIEVVNWGVGLQKQDTPHAILTPQNCGGKDPAATVPQDMAGLQYLRDTQNDRGNDLQADITLKKCYNIAKQYLLYVGSAYPHKNLAFLLEAFKEVDLGLQLVLVGKDSYFYQKLKKKVQDLKLDEDVIFTDYIDDEKLNLLYKQALAFVFPTLVEGFGFPPLEAMANGVPVISSNTTCLPEVLDDAVLYFDPKNKKELKKRILDIVNNKELREKLVQKGFKQVKKYSWGKCAREYLDIINLY